MMTNLFKYTLLLFLLNFAACSSEDYVAPTVPNGQPQPGDALELTVSAGDFVTDGAPDTRATDNGNETTFENGDRVGIIILDKSNVPIYNNIPYKYNGGKWVFDSNNGEGKGACYYDPEATTYIVYYPYNKLANDCKSENELKKILPPKTNQSTEVDYRISDLMVWSSGSQTFPLKTLVAKLKHVYASVSLSPEIHYKLDNGEISIVTPPSLKVSDLNITINNNVYITYTAADGSQRCILPTDVASSEARCFYTIGGKNYNNTIHLPKVVANTRYTSIPQIKNVLYTLENVKVGDFYCRKVDNNGYVIPGDATLTPKQQADCVGVVYCVDKDFIAEKSKYKNDGGFTHGLVVALKDASAGARWKDRWESDAFTVASNYDLDSAPTNSSGWYLPNYNELRYICRGSNYTKQSTNGKNMLHDKFVKLGEEAAFFGYDYWSSTSYRETTAYFIYFSDGDYNDMRKDFKSMVRSSLAF